MSDYSRNILAINLNSPVYYNNDTDLYNQFVGFYPNHVVISSWQLSIGKGWYSCEDCWFSVYIYTTVGEYLALDTTADTIFWSDTSLRRVSFASYAELLDANMKTFVEHGVAYTPPTDHKSYYPVGQFLLQLVSMLCWGVFAVSIM